MSGIENGNDIAPTGKTTSESGRESESDIREPPKEKLDFVRDVRELLLRCSSDNVLPYVSRGGMSADEHTTLLTDINIIAGILGSFRKRGTLETGFPEGFGYRRDVPIRFVGLAPDKKTLKVSPRKVLIGKSARDFASRLRAFLDRGELPPENELFESESGQAQADTGSRDERGSYDYDWFYDIFRNMHTQSEQRRASRERRERERRIFVEGIERIRAARNVEELATVVHDMELVIHYDDPSERSFWWYEDIRPGSTGRIATNRRDEWTWEAEDQGGRLWTEKLAEVRTKRQSLKNLNQLRREAIDFFRSLHASQAIGAGSDIVEEIGFLAIREAQNLLDEHREYTAREIERNIEEPLRRMLWPFVVDIRYNVSSRNDPAVSREYSVFMENARKRQEEAPTRLKKLFERLKRK